MGVRIIVLVVILVVGFTIMEISILPSIDGESLTTAALFCAVMISLIFFQATRPKKSIGKVARFAQSVVASIACSVALTIILHIFFLIAGIDFLDVVGSSLVPVVVLALAIFILPVFWYLLRDAEEKTD